MKKHDIDPDHFFIDLHFFQQSSVRQEDFKEVCSITNVVRQYVLQHCQTSIEKVLVGIIDQLVTYILTLLKSLQNKILSKVQNGVASTDRYQRISKLLKKNALLPVMSFVVNICTNDSFIKPDRNKISAIFFNKFIRLTYFMNKTKMKPMKAVKSLDVTDRKFQLVCVLLSLLLY